MTAPTPRIPTPHPIRPGRFVRPALQPQAPASGSGQTDHYRPGPGITEPLPGTINGIGAGLAASEPFPDTRDDAAPTPVPLTIMRALTTPTSGTEATRGTDS